MTVQSPVASPPPAVVRRRLPVWGAMVLIALSALTLRLPSFFEPHHYGDEGVFAATAQQLLEGQTLYAGAWDNKPPLAFVVYAAVLSLFGPSMLPLRLLGAVWAAATALAVFGIARRPAGSGGGLAAAIFFAVLAALPFTESMLLLTEALMALPVAAGVLAAVTATACSSRRGSIALAVAGLLLGAGFLFKQVAAFDAAAVGLWLLLRRSQGWRAAGVLTLGWCAAVGAGVLSLAAVGGLEEGWRAVIGSYRLYLGEGSALPAALTVLKPAPLLLAVAWAWRKRRRGGEVTGRELIMLWFGFALFGVTLAGRPFGHYLVQLFAPGALLAGMALGRMALVGGLAPTPDPSPNPGGGEPRTREASLPMMRPLVAPLALLLFGAYVVASVFGGFWGSHGTVTPTYYGNWTSWVTGRTNRAEYERFHSWRVANQQELVRLIRADGGERTLFVWGEYPWLYALLEARNPTRFATSYQTALLPGAKVETVRDLERTPPRYIVQEREEWRRLPGLTALLERRYEALAFVDNTVLWRLRE